MKWPSGQFVDEPPVQLLVEIEVEGVEGLVRFAEVGVLGPALGGFGINDFVADPPLLKTMFYLWERLKLVVEPTGALAAAAVLECTLPIAGKRVGVILSGGNGDLTLVPEWLVYR